jgi:biopolymer transport protein ExbB/TolQ
MSPNGLGRSGKTVATSNIYTIILAVAFGLVVATAAYVAYMCYTQYGTIWKIQ